jgi:hypothetical protein
MDLERDDDAMSSVPDEIDADLRTVKRTWYVFWAGEALTGTVVGLASVSFRLANICCFFKFFGLLVTVLSAILAYADTAWISAEFKKDHPEMTDPIRAVVLAILAGVIAVIAFLTEYSIDKARTRILLWCADEIRKVALGQTGWVFLSFRGVIRLGGHEASRTSQVHSRRSRGEEGCEE